MPALEAAAPIDMAIRLVGGNASWCSKYVANAIGSSTRRARHRAMRNVQLPRILRNAELRPTTFDERTRTVEIAWNIGPRLLHDSVLKLAFEEELVAEGCRLERLNTGAPFLYG